MEFFEMCVCVYFFVVGWFNKIVFVVWDERILLKERK